MFQYSKILESPNKHNVMTSFGIRLIRILERAQIRIKFNTRAGRMAEAEFETDSSVRGYHVYQDNWTPVIGERLHCER